VPDAGNSFKGIEFITPMVVPNVRDHRGPAAVLQLFWLERVVQVPIAHEHLEAGALRDSDV
jgi:hypothetical protein